MMTFGQRLGDLGAKLAIAALAVFIIFKVPFLKQNVAGIVDEN